MLKNLKKEQFFCGLSDEELEKLARKFPLFIFEEKDEFVGKTKECILEMYKDYEVGIFQEENTLYSFLDFSIGTSHLLCVLCIDVCVKACLIKDENVAFCTAILFQEIMSKRALC